MTRVVRLSEVASIERSVRAPGRITAGTPYVGLENIESGGEIVGVRGVDAGELASAKFDFTDRHVLFGKLRPYLAKIALPSFAGVCSTDIVPILPGDDIDRRYLCWFLRQSRIVDLAASRSVGANLPRLNPLELAKFLIPLPPISEQRRIAALLDQADELRAKRRAAVAVMDSLNESIFLDMFGSGGYPQAPLSHHLSFLTSGSRGWARYYADRGPLFLRIQNVLRDRLELSDIARVAAPDNAEARRTRVRAGDVLMSITADLGRTCVVPPEADGAFINQHLCLMRSETLVPRFLSAFLTSAPAVRQIVRKNRAAVKAGLNFDDVRSLMIPLPPTASQHEFARHAAAVDRERDRLLLGAAVTGELFQSLQHRAFAGAL